MKECFAIVNAAPSLLRLLSLGMMVSFTLTNQGGGGGRQLYIVGGLLILVTLLVGGSLGIVGSTLLVVEGLPALTEETTDLAFHGEKWLVRLWIKTNKHREHDYGDLTELDTRVLLTHILTLLVGEEHVRRETTLGCVRVCRLISLDLWQDDAWRCVQQRRIDIPFLALRPFSTLAPFLAAALGILVELGRAILVDERRRDVAD